MRFAGRLARLWKRAALLPPKDPLQDLDDRAMARAQEVLRVKMLDDGWFPQGRPAIAPEDAAWFEVAIRPFLPAYAVFCGRFEAWRRRLDPPRGLFARRAHACNFPAFAGRPRPELRLQANLVAAMVAADAAGGT